MVSSKFGKLAVAGLLVPLLGMSACSSKPAPASGPQVPTAAPSTKATVAPTTPAVSASTSAQASKISSSTPAGAATAATATLQGPTLTDSKGYSWKFGEMKANLLPLTTKLGDPGKVYVDKGTVDITMPITNNTPGRSVNLPSLDATFFMLVPTMDTCKAISQQNGFHLTRKDGKVWCALTTKNLPALFEGPRDTMSEGQTKTYSFGGSYTTPAVAQASSGGQVPESDKDKYSMDAKNYQYALILWTDHYQGMRGTDLTPMKDYTVKKGTSAASTSMSVFAASDGFLDTLA